MKQRYSLEVFDYTLRIKQSGQEDNSSNVMLSAGRSWLYCPEEEIEKLVSFANLGADFEHFLKGDTSTLMAYIQEMRTIIKFNDSTDSGRTK